MSKSAYKIFDQSKLNLLPISKRVSDIHINSFISENEFPFLLKNPYIKTIAERIIRSRKNKNQVILMMGAHVVRSGTSKHIINLMKRGFITHIAMNGAGPIHEFELALKGETTESVSRYIKEGQFGLWKETGKLNEIIKLSFKEKLGLGEGIGKFIYENNLPYREFSILSAGYQLKIPVTVHVGIGYDIIHEHANCDGAAIGETSYRDFLIFARSIEEIEGGVLLCFGSAVMAPEVFLKALSMARNVAYQKGNKIDNFTTSVFDIVKLKNNYHHEAQKNTPEYYFRPWKTLLVRTVANCGESFYIKGEHIKTIPSLHHHIIKALK